MYQRRRLLCGRPDGPLDLGSGHNSGPTEKAAEANPRVALPAGQEAGQPANVTVTVILLGVADGQ